MLVDAATAVDDVVYGDAAEVATEYQVVYGDVAEVATEYQAVVT